MSRDDLFDWGAAYGYPRMVLTINPPMMLKAGWEAWYTFLRTASFEQVRALESRVQYWETIYRTFALMGE